MYRPASRSTRKLKVLGAVLLLACFAVPSQMLGQGADFDAPGRVEGAAPPLSIGVAATGIVSDVLVHAGDRVQTGQLLVTLDCSAQRADLRVQQARLAAAQATYDKFRNGPRPDEIAVGEAVVNFSAARADEAEKTLQRTLALQEGVTVTAAHVLEVKRDARIAEAQLAEARAQLDLLRAGSREEDIRQAKALRDAAAAALDESRAHLDQCSVKAPAAGVVLDVAVNRGQLLSLAVPQPLLRIEPDGPSRVRAEVPLSDLARVCPQQRARIAADALPRAAINAKVESISPMISHPAMSASAPEHPRAESVAVMLDVDGGGPALPIGLPVTVHFEPCPTKS